MGKKNRKKGREKSRELGHKKQKKNSSNFPDNDGERNKD